MFGLDLGKGVTSDKFKEIARQNVLDNYDVVVTENLHNKGAETRFKVGCKGRTKDQVSAQTKNRLREHIQNITPNKK